MKSGVSVGRSGEFSPARAVPVLVAGVLAMSSASILIRLCQVPALSIATYRLVIAALLFVSVSMIRERGRFGGAKQLNRWVLASGAFLSLHFATWIRSLDYTTVASSVLLVQTSPVFVGVAAHLLLKESPSRRQWVGIALALVGTTAVAGLDFSADRRALLGDALALAGAVGGAGYWICGRVARRRSSTGDYVAAVYSVAALILLIVTRVAGRPLSGFSSRDLLLLVLIALVPQAIGHTSFNWALRHFSATAVSVFALGEPVGASILAFLFLSEKIPALNLIGAALVLTGVFLAVRGERAGIS